MRTYLIAFIRLNWKNQGTFLNVRLQLFFVVSSVTKLCQDLTWMAIVGRKLSNQRYYILLLEVRLLFRSIETMFMF